MSVQAQAVAWILDVMNNKEGAVMHNIALLGQHRQRRGRTLAAWIGYNPAHRITHILLAEDAGNIVVTRYLFWHQAAPSIGRQLSRGDIAPGFRLVLQGSDQVAITHAGNDDATSLSAMMYQAQHAWGLGYGNPDMGVHTFRYSHPSMGHRMAAIPPDKIIADSEDRHPQLWHTAWGNIPRLWQ